MIAWLLDSLRYRMAVARLRRMFERFGLVLETRRHGAIVDVVVSTGEVRGWYRWRVPAAEMVASVDRLRGLGRTA